MLPLGCINITLQECYRKCVFARGCLRRVSQECFSGVFLRDVSLGCVSGVCLRGVSQECVSGVCHLGV
jgi:hypothetical protein